MALQERTRFTIGSQAQPEITFPRAVFSRTPDLARHISYCAQVVSTYIQTARKGPSPSCCTCRKTSLPPHLSPWAEYVCMVGQGARGRQWGFLQKPFPSLHHLLGLHGLEYKPGTGNEDRLAICNSLCILEWRPTSLLQGLCHLSLTMQVKC